MPTDTESARSRYCRRRSPVFGVGFVVACCVLLPAVTATFAGRIKYTCDSADRLIAADYGGGKVTLFTYDANGSLLNRTTQTAATANLRFSANSVSPSTTAAGNVFTCTFTVRNDGPHAASEIMFQSVLPFGTKPLTVSAGQGSGSISGQTADASLGVLPVGASTVVAITARHGFAGSFDITATVTARQTDTVPANNTSTVAATATAPLDSDADGMPNWWEAINISSGAPFTASSAAKAGANDDFDGDGISNIDEFSADTPANDASAFFKFSEITLESGGYALTFHSSSFRRYTVEVSNVPGGPFSPVLENIEGTGGELTLTGLTPPSDRRFYHVRPSIPQP